MIALSVAFALGMAILAVQGPQWARALWVRWRRATRGGWKNGAFGASGRPVWWVMGLAATIAFFALAGPGIGLAGLILALIAASLGLKFSQWRRQLQYQAEAYQFLQALNGLQLTGLAYAPAIWKLSRRLPGRFAERVRRQLGGYRAGESLSGCFEEFVKQFPSGSLHTLFRLLEVSQRRGLPTRALLERALPLIAQELALQREALSLQHQLALQVAFAALLPWGLNCFLYWMQPELWAATSGRSTGMVAIVVVSCLAWEVGGIYLLLRWTRFP